MAQVDSSVGGKVAVNLPKGKNMVGAFYQPCLVLADTKTLDTLDKKQYAAGMAEVIKYAFIYDANLYEILTNEDADIAKIVKRCCEIKAEYVDKDPFDTGIRMQLNYGHTIGHAIETVSGYGTFLHGEGVAIGMVFAAKIGEKLGVSPKDLEEKTVSLLKKYNLPYEIDENTLNKALDILLLDKKAEGKKINFILIDKIGHAVAKKLGVDEIKELLA